MKYRLLSGDEKQALVAAFPQYEGTDLQHVPIAGAVDEGGEVCGLAVLNLAAHCEPVWIAPKSGVDFRRLVAVVDSAAKEAGCKELWVFAPNEKIARMAEIVGYADTGWKVYKKEF